MCCSSCRTSRSWFINFMSSVKRESHFAIAMARVEVGITIKTKTFSFIGKTIKENYSVQHRLSKCMFSWRAGGENLNRNAKKHAIKQVKVDVTGFYLCCISRPLVYRILFDLYFIVKTNLVVYCWAIALYITFRWFFKNKMVYRTKSSIHTLGRIEKRSENACA